MIYLFNALKRVIDRHVKSWIINENSNINALTEESRRAEITREAGA
jgi:hypothetical protein